MMELILRALIQNPPAEKITLIPNGALPSCERKPNPKKPQNGAKQDLVQTLSCLSTIITPAFAQPRQQGEGNASRNQAIEELEKRIAVAEAACPGVTDKIVKKLTENFCKCSADESPEGTYYWLLLHMNQGNPPKLLRA